jgi:calcineurin-like phosphoesterase family protein
MLWLTADLHLGHKNIIGYTGRPFDTVEQMDQTLIDNVNARVQKDDRLIIVGDFAFGKPQPYLEKINCNRISLIPGNHDGRWWKELERSTIDLLSPLVTLTDYPVPIVLCHYPLETWDRRQYGSRHAHGHVHGRKMSSVKGRIDVGVDPNNFCPVSVDDFFKKTEA